jgi:uncharacterized protein (DUF1810 family)
MVGSLKLYLARNKRTTFQHYGNHLDLKLRTSATLFASVSAPVSVFHRLLEKFYPGGPDKETLRLLGISSLS